MNPATALDRRLMVATVVVLALHALSLVVLCWQQKLTPDESNYLLAGCILRHELRWDAYNTVLHGPLAFWPNQLGVLVADPGDLGAYLPWGRLGFVPFTLLAALALVRLARAAFGAPVALAALLLWCTNPLVLAHGCLMTADMALTCASLWTIVAAWRWLAAPTWPRLLLVGIVLGLALATKYLALLLVPTLGLLLLGALAFGFAPRLLWSRRRDGLGARSTDTALAAVTVALVAGVTLHSAYLWQVPGFAARPAPPGVEVAAEDGAYGPKSAGLRAFGGTQLGRAALRLLPEPWVRGADYQKLVSEGLPTFFGDRVAPGFWSYYVLAFGTKLPIVALLLLLAGLFVRTPPWPRFLALVVALAVGVPLIFLSGITRLQIGVRYALPAVPFLCLVAGRALAAMTTARCAVDRLLGLSTAVALVVVAACTWPGYLSAFNVLAPRPYLWFKDSTLDWSADAPSTDRDLAALRARHPEGQPITGASGPRFGQLLVHGEQLAPRDPRDPDHIYHWLRRFWPIDRAGAWFAFDVQPETFHAALQQDRPTARRGQVELAIAAAVAGDFATAAALLRAADDPDAAAVAAAVRDLQSGDPAREAAALLQLGQHHLVIARGERAPRPLRVQALSLAGDAAAVIALLTPDAEHLAGMELYALAAALAATGRPAEAVTLLERTRPADPASAQTHDAILRRLREVTQASARADTKYLRR